MKVGTEFSNVWGEYKNHSNPYIQGTTVPCDNSTSHSSNLKMCVCLATRVYLTELVSPGHPAGPLILPHPPLLFIPNSFHGGSSWSSNSTCPTTHICLIKLLSRKPVRYLSAHPTTRVYFIKLLSLGHRTGPLTLCPSHHSCLSHQTPLTGPPNKSTNSLPIPPLVFISSNSSPPQTYDPHKAFTCRNVHKPQKTFPPTSGTA